MKLQLGLSSKARSLFAYSLPTKKTSEGDRTGAQLDAGVGFDDQASNSDIFFESRAWMDSDCEDDFFSVNGEFTPSRGSTPLHPLSSLTIPPPNKALLNNSAYFDHSEKSPTVRRPTFAEHLQDKVHVVALDKKENVFDHKLKMTRDRIDDEGVSEAKESNCCFPRLKFIEWKSKKTSPEHANVR